MYLSCNELYIFTLKRKNACEMFHAICVLFTANTTSHVTSPPARQYHRSSLQQMVGQQGHTSTVSPPGRPQHRRKPNFLDKIAIFNMPNIMLIGLTLPRINPELDSEAHLPNRSSFEKRAARRKRLKCICGWLWCKLMALIDNELFYDMTHFFVFLNF